MLNLSKIGKGDVFCCCKNIGGRSKESGVQSSTVTGACIYVGLAAVMDLFRCDQSGSQQPWNDMIPAGRPRLTVHRAVQTVSERPAGTTDESGTASERPLGTAERGPVHGETQTSEPWAASLHVGTAVDCRTWPDLVPDLVPRPTGREGWEEGQGDTLFVQQRFVYWHCLRCALVIQLLIRYNVILTSAFTSCLATELRALRLVYFDPMPHFNYS